ncbi:MAG: outer membrane beta-barrel protein [Draconibacterium sp.]
MKISSAIRKVVFSLILFWGATLVGFGQVGILLLIFGDKASTEELHFSIDGAFNFSSASHLPQGQAILGANFGLGLHVMLNDRWEFNPQLRPLSQKGAWKTPAIVDIPSEILEPVNSWKLNYIEFPVMMRYRIIPDLSVAAGLQMSLLASARQFSKGNYTNGVNAEIRVNVESYFRKLNFSLPLEMAYRLKLSRAKSASPISLDVFARYCPDFYPLFRDDQEFEHSKLSTWQFGVSFPFIFN